MGWHNHHVFPQQFHDEFLAAGIDPDLYVVTLYQEEHVALHQDGWNAQWDHFFDNYHQGSVQPSVDEVIDYGQHLMEQYGFADYAPHPQSDGYHEP